MSLNTNICPACSRREMLKVGALAAIPLMSGTCLTNGLRQGTAFYPESRRAAVPNRTQQPGVSTPEGSSPIAANGSTDPYPIPWLDKNGSHNQPAGPDLEPSHIYHFKGKVARCSTFTGMGTDNQGNRIPFGGKTTDYGVMSGDYWAARTTQHGTLTHI